MHRKLDCKAKVMCPNEISGYVWKMNYMNQEAAGVLEGGVGASQPRTAGSHRRRSWEGGLEGEAHSPPAWRSRGKNNNREGTSSPTS